jgi:hypothetical protein
MTPRSHPYVPGDRPDMLVGTHALRRKSAIEQPRLTLLLKRR